MTTQREVFRQNVSQRDLVDMCGFLFCPVLLLLRLPFPRLAPGDPAKDGREHNVHKQQKHDEQDYRVGNPELLEKAGRR
jgi:hypothetical protein